MNKRKDASRVLLDSDEDEGDGGLVEFKVNQDYAKKYDDWRAKEEMQKLKDRYGEDVNEDESESTSESEDEDAEALTPQIERDFFKTLAFLKSEDADLSNKGRTFFTREQESPTDYTADGVTTSKSKKPMFLRDYERKIIVENNGVIDESSDKLPAKYQSSYSQEQEEVKHGLAKLAQDDDEDDDILVERNQTEHERKQDEEDYSEWLRSQSDQAKSGKHEELESLKQFWADPQLDEGEKFLRDYFLDKKYLDKDANRIPTYSEIVNDEHFSEEEEDLEKAEEFEHKYNFRFEEPDPDFIKRYPRTLNDSLRRKDDTRKVKRDEIKERREAEKERVREDIKQLKRLKRREILQKIEKLKSISGNDDLHFEEVDLEGDFDPDKHDSMMKKAFNDEYFEGEEEMERPDISDESDMDENWLEEKKQEEEEENLASQTSGNGLQNSEQAIEDGKTESHAAEVSRKSKSRRRTKVSEAVQKQKPAFDPNQKKLEEYLDEYYKLDFEDIVAGAPTRFKYRTVIPNDFGLTIDEILAAPDRELNAWCTLKKTVQYRPEEEEMYDVRTYKQKGSLKDIKHKIIPSLAEMQASTSTSNNETSTNVTEVQVPENGKKKRRRKKKNQGHQQVETGQNERSESLVDKPIEEPSEKGDISTIEPPLSKETNGEKNELVPKSSKKKRRSGKKKSQEAEKKPETTPVISAEAKADTGQTAKEAVKLSRNQKRRLTRKRKLEATGATKNREDGLAPHEDEATTKPPPAKKTKSNYDHEKFLKTLPSARISDERLKAYGLHPKKFRAKEKYVLMAKAKAPVENTHS